MRFYPSREERGSIGDGDCAGERRRQESRRSRDGDGSRLELRDAVTAARRRQLLRPNLSEEKDPTIPVRAPVIHAADEAFFLLLKLHFFCSFKKNVTLFCNNT